MAIYVCKNGIHLALTRQLQIIPFIIHWKNEENRPRIREEKTRWDLQEGVSILFYSKRWVTTFSIIAFASYTDTWKHCWNVLFRILTFRNFFSLYEDLRHSGIYIQFTNHKFVYNPMYFCAYSCTIILYISLFAI